MAHAELDFGDVRAQSFIEFNARATDLIEDDRLFNLVWRLYGKGLWKLFPDAIARSVKRTFILEHYRHGRYKRYIDFHKALLPAVKHILLRSSSRIHFRKHADVDHSRPTVYVSTHRDIFTDSMLVGSYLVSRGHHATYNAAGDNLYQDPTLEKFLSLGKAFKVMRGSRAGLDTVRALSGYIQHIVAGGEEDGQAVWIAQSPGRCFDGMDTTDSKILKMISLMWGKDTGLKGLVGEVQFVPIAISYERDPLDKLRANRLVQEILRVETPDRNDLEESFMGVVGEKGRIDVTFCEPIKPEELVAASASANSELCASLITRRIVENLSVWPVNVAARQKLETLDGSIPRFEDFPEIEQRERVIAEKFCDSRIKDCSSAVAERILRTYAAPITHAMELGVTNTYGSTSLTYSNFRGTE